MSHKYMEINPDRIESPDAIYSYAVDLYTNENRSLGDIKNSLIQKGVENERASDAVNRLEQQIFEAQDKSKREKAANDMLYGGLWFTWYTVGHWIDSLGAILFGAIQFFRGVSNYR